jgi:hypothetical protein
VCASQAPAAGAVVLAVGPLGQEDHEAGREGHLFPTVGQALPCAGGGGEGVTLSHPGLPDLRAGAVLGGHKSPEREWGLSQP